MTDPIKMTVEHQEFDRVVAGWLNNDLPEGVVKNVNEVAKDVRKELVKASPVGPAPSAERARRRAKVGGKRGYGPIAKAWKRKGIRRMGETAIVRNAAFYAPLVEFGSSRMGARPFTRQVVSRIDVIARRTLARLERRG